jgi:magnesium chelatase family protein
MRIHITNRMPRFCRFLRFTCQALLKTAMRHLHLAARAYHCVLKFGSMIADFAGSVAITQVHLAEALQYRPKIDFM